jgi:MoxR-like ATPase
MIREIYVDEKLRDYIVDLIVATRNPADYGLKSITNYLEYGASPRATIFLNLAARAHAFVNHRGFVTPEDIKSVAPDVLRHRVVLSFEAEAEEISTEQIIDTLLETIEVP